MQQKKLEGAFGLGSDIPGPPEAVQGNGASPMTLAERNAYLHPGAATVNVTWGYPEGLSPHWLRELQARPPAGFLDQPPSEYLTVISGYFARLFGCRNVTLAPTCSIAFVVAAQAIIRSPGDEVIVVETSYDSYPSLLRSLGARVRHARRGLDGLPDLEGITAAVTSRTRAIVIVSPDNPLGVVYPQALLKQIIALCEQRDLLLLADHCMAEVNPLRVQIPLLPQLAASRNLSWIALGDTGKILGLGGSKFGALAYPDSWRDRLEAAASNWYFQHNQFDLAVLAAILADPRFAAYRVELSDQVGANLLDLRQKLKPPLTVRYGGAGSFCLVDAAGLVQSDISFAQLLDRHGVLVVPMSWFPPGRKDTRVRVSLARTSGTIAALAEALNLAAGRTA